MKTGRVTWGLILLSVGGVLLAEKLFLIEFDWSEVFRLWPVGIVVAGTSLLLPKTGWGRLVALLIAVVAIVSLVYIGVTPDSSKISRAGTERTIKSRRTLGDRLRMRSIEGQPFNSSISTVFTDSIKFAALVIEGEGFNYNIHNSAEYLFLAESDVAFGPHYLITKEPTRADSSVSLRFAMDRSNAGQRGGVKPGFSQKVSNIAISLHQQPTWDISLKMGADSADLDLRAFTLSRLQVECGAALVKAHLGSPIGEIPVHVEGDEMSVRLDIPRAVACRIEVESPLSATSFPEFDKQEDGAYETAGYAVATDRYIIRLKGGLTSFSVDRTD